MCIRDRQWKPLEHQGVLFDEGTPAMVLKQKKLFQVQPAWVDLGMSTTNCYSYRVMMGMQKLMICSNTWLEQLQELSAADKEWIESNQILEHVVAPLWEPDVKAPELPEKMPDQSEDSGPAEEVLPEEPMSQTTEVSGSGSS